MKMRVNCTCRGFFWGQRPDVTSGHLTRKVQSFMRNNAYFLIIIRWFCICLSEIELSFILLACVTHTIGNEWSFLSYIMKSLFIILLTPPPPPPGETRKMVFQRVQFKNFPGGKPPGPPPPPEAPAFGTHVCAFGAQVRLFYLWIR